MTGRIVRVALAAAMALSVAGAVPAAAKEGDVIKTGACSGTSDWKLKLSPDNGRIEVEYEVDSNKIGQTWRVKIFHDGDRIFAGTRETKGPSGSFTVRVLANDSAGPDAFKGRASNAATDELCVGRATF